MKQEWVVIDCDKQDEFDDNHSNMQRQKQRNMDCTATMAL